MKKIIVFILFGTFGSVCTMDKPSAQILYREPKTLTEIAALKSVQNIQSIEEFKKIVSLIPADLRCDLVKKIIHNPHFTQAQVIQLINTYCNNDPLLKAYTYYVRLTLSNRKQNITSMRALRQAAEYNEDGNTVAIITELITIASADDTNRTLLRVLINANRLEQIKLALSLGEKPTIQELVYAIALNRNDIVQLLINANAPLQSEKLLITEQPLHTAFYSLNETAIATLIAQGASLTNKFLIITNSNQIDTIPNDIRIRIRNWNGSWTYQGMTLEQMEQRFVKILGLLNKYAPAPRDLYKRKSL